ncbi:MAG TPA: bifunctional heptose 7-phosphate kinase/heptose 1-phosphate adenyltransferase [Candidatus Binataceae bacterium]|nr:bifunctional heptose 7-phosphate kinase/heptose 1-phosphate adenyltransferase [Candidatus Binataceae bacterium]
MATAKTRTRAARRAVSAPPAHPAHAELPRLPKLRVMVAGEVILDRYVWGDVSRVSPEAPIPVLRVTRREEKPGNAGFVMANLRALGASACALSIVGADRDGMLLREILAGLGIGTRAVITDPERPTIVKERMLGSVQAAYRGTQQLLRVDQEDQSPISPARERELAARYRAELPRIDGVLISDINKGLLTETLIRTIIDGARRRRIPVIADPRLSGDFSIYRGASVLAPNRYETEQATGIKLVDRDAWRRAAEMLVERLGLEACLVTLDRDGMYLAERGGADTYIPTVPRDVYDVTGAGDVVLSVFGLFTIAGLGYASAARLANLAASLEVTRIGAEVITREDLAQALRPAHQGYERKIAAVDEIAAVLERERRAGRTIAFTNGCFDLLHAGHVQALNFARAQADLLVVGLNSDRGVRALKGKTRPIYPAAERARILAALQCVDYVVIFDETRAERIIRTVKPDVLIKGEDWRGKTVDGQEFVEARGGRVVLSPILAGRSTTRTIARLAGN